MATAPFLTLINQQDGHLAFKLFAFEDNNQFDHLQRHNYYSLIWVREGQGLAKVDCAEYAFGPNTLFAFAPYQPFLLSTAGTLRGVALHFHSDFYCIHRHPRETDCDAVLFNNVYHPPFQVLEADAAARLAELLGQLRAEAEQAPDGQYELLIAYLKIVLVTASRLKAQAPVFLEPTADSQVPYLLHQLKKTIEAHYKVQHSASDYAGLLHLSAGALAKLVKAHFHKTLTELITERIIVEAKRELYLTSKPVKEIAYGLGYADEFYFSRVFKTYADVSPQLYRDTVGFGKAEGTPARP